MKIKFLIASILTVVLTASVAFAQTKPAPKSETIKVWGNCGMCKTTIETAAKDAGASTAVWNKTTKMLKITYLASATSGAKEYERKAAKKN